MKACCCLFERIGAPRLLGVVSIAAMNKRMGFAIPHAGQVQSNVGVPMSYNVVPFEQTGVPIREHLALRTEADATEAASRERQEPWPANSEVPTALVVANGFVR